MVGKCVRHALVGLFGAPHCGACDSHLAGSSSRCGVPPSERKRMYVSGEPWPCQKASPSDSR